MFILVDCNNFYASCERVFNPKIRNKAVIVLSNNDGCVIARSKEAKKLDIPMGAPIFKYKDLIERKNIFVFSSNFPLYGDMSMRVMKTLESFDFKMEIYSIDEAFLYISDKNIDFEKLSWKIKNRVYRWSGIPVSVGVAKTKTLCKLANETVFQNAKITAFTSTLRANISQYKTPVTINPFLNVCSILFSTCDCQSGKSSNWLPAILI